MPMTFYPKVPLWFKLHFSHSNPNTKWCYLSTEERWLHHHRPLAAPLHTYEHTHEHTTIFTECRA